MTSSAWARLPEKPLKAFCRKELGRKGWTGEIKRPSELDVNPCMNY